LFTASSEAAILRKIRDCQIPPIRKINPSVPPELEKIVNKVLSKDPNLRYQTATALHKDLNRFLNTFYPEFNPQEFAIFIKNTFAQAFQETKQKLVTYAHVQGGDTREPSVPSKREGTDATIIDNSLLEEEKLTLDTSSYNRVDLNQLKGKDTATRVRIPGVPAAMPAGAQNFPAYQTKKQMESTQPKIRAGTRTGIRHKQDSSGLAIFTAFAVIAGFSFFAYTSGMLPFGPKSHNPKPTPVAEEKVPAPTTAPLPQGVIEQTSQANYQVTISSSPPGAHIYFDGVDQSSFTPKAMNLEGNKVVHVTLKKDGYYFYEIDFTAVRDAQPLQANLQALGEHAAYVSFALVGGGQNPILEINGHHIGDRAPIEKYPIPARVPVQIRARNAFTGAMAETTITLQPDEWKKNLELVLGTGN